MILSKHLKAWLLLVRLLFRRQNYQQNQLIDHDGREQIKVSNSLEKHDLCAQYVNVYRTDFDWGDYRLQTFRLSSGREEEEGQGRGFYI